jgi:hypothetical protein
MNELQRFKFGWLEASWVAGLALVIFLAKSPYLGPSPYVIGKWSGTPAVMPAGLEQTAGRFAHLNITAVDPAGNVSGTLTVAAVARPFVGKMYGRHMSLVISSSRFPGPAYYGRGFEGTVRDGSIDGTLTEIGTSEWNRNPLNYEIVLTPDTGDD